MSKNLKQKGRQILKGMKCEYCDFRAKTKTELKKHQTEIHGHFKTINPVKKKKITPNQEKVVFGGVTYVWNHTYQRYDEVLSYDPKTKNKDKPRETKMKNGDYIIKCINCSRMKRLNYNPYLVNYLKNGKRATRKMKSNERPMLPCPHCGCNLFRPEATNGKRK